MKILLTAGAMLALSATAVLAQPPAAPAAAPAGPMSPVSTAPTYASIKMEIDVKKSAADTWKRVGKFCDIGEWLRIPNCQITAGKDGDFGAVRTVGGEVLVGMTPLSYTYAQVPRANARAPYNAYHGTLEARPVTATTSKLVYTLFYDNSMLADDAARATDLANRRRSFEGALANMKILAEGQPLPPPAARPAPPAAPAPAAK